MPSDMTGGARDPATDRLVFLCVLSAALLYMVSELVTWALMLDGAVYGGIARHLSEGTGSFWVLPHFEADATSFNDHPPLALWLQGLWFSLVGDAFWSEKLYGVMLFFLLAWLLGRVYRELGGPAAAWWPLLLFLLMPVSTRVIKTNMLELPVALFSLAAFWAAWRGRRNGAWDIAVGMLVCAAALVKGPAAIFALCAPGVVAWIVDDSFRRAIARSLVTSVCFAVPLGLLFVYPPARDALMSYVEVQVLASLAGERPILHGRLYQLGQLGLQLGILVAVIALVSRAFEIRPVWSRAALATFIVGLAASLPLLVSPRQFKAYLFPALPFFALAAALLVNPPLLDRWRRLLSAALAVLVVALLARTGLLYGEPGNDRERLEDMEKIAAAAGLRETTVVTFCQPDDQLRVYLWRHESLQSRVRHADQAGRGLYVCADVPGGERLADLSRGRAVWWRDGERQVTFTGH